MLHRARIVLAEKPATTGKDPEIVVLHQSYDALAALGVFNAQADKYPEVVMIEHGQITRRRTTVLPSAVSSESHKKIKSAKA